MASWERLENVERLVGQRHTMMYSLATGEGVALGLTAGTHAGSGVDHVPLAWHVLLEIEVVRLNPASHMYSAIEAYSVN